MYEHGDMKRKSFRWAREWYTKAAEQGHEKAVLALECVQLLSGEGDTSAASSTHSSPS